MRVVNVSLGTRSYKIRLQISKMGLTDLGEECLALGLGRKCAVITDTNVAQQGFFRSALASLKKSGFDSFVITVPSGETSKRLHQVEACYEQLAAHRLERKSFIVALGGGVVGDLAGFVAASYLRGIPFVQVPTTLLAQVDSSVGGKTGVNLAAGKNLVGAFYQPRFVLCDIRTLMSLPEREFRSGLAEVIKYGIIYDADLFARLEEEMSKILRRDGVTLARIVARSCVIKAEVVSQDETESGLRAILNYGHTIGHAIEAITAYGRYLHGEAISIGQVVAAHLSAELLGLPVKDVERIRALFVAAGLPVSIKLSSTQRAKLLAAMTLDKKVSAGEIKFVLAERIGKVVWGQRVPTAAVHRALDQLGTPNSEHRTMQ